jgi:hypothetical protein
MSYGIDYDWLSIIAIAMLFLVFAVPVLEKFKRK